MQNLSQQQLNQLCGIKYISSKYFDTYQNLAINSKNIFLKRVFKNLYTCKSDFVKSIEDVLVHAKSNEEQSTIPSNYREMMPEIGFSTVIKNCYQIELAIHETCRSEYFQNKNQVVKNILREFIEKHSKLISELHAIDFNSLALTNQPN
ncbi:hypothetical protein [Leeuwenhoekiella sp. W20_SRS_FM14]|uniref:hypothetical protein n=1 Tax=Leeuwenhoekiella sp. W20_SRS_FM14 TaxID=3240270 RepID=UPI003F9DE25F